MEILSEDMITRWLLPHLPVRLGNRRPSVNLAEVVGSIGYKLKTGYQERWLLVKALSWQGNYYCLNTWGKKVAWKALIVNGLCLSRRALGLSVIPLDDSRTPARNSRATIGYQGRKVGRTTKALFLAGNQGLPPAVATPQADKQHNKFELERVFAELRLNGLFLNAGGASNGSSLRQAYVRQGSAANIPRSRCLTNWQTDDDTSLDPGLYRRWLVTERLNAWLDGFKALLVRYEANLQSQLPFIPAA